MSERDMRSKVVACLRQAGLDAYAVENPAWPGTPDVNFAEGWIELKKVDKWPAGEGTVLQVPHFTTVQRHWLERRWRASRSAWMLIQVARDWLLLSGEVAACLVGRSNKQQLTEAATHHWAAFSEVAEELPRCLSRTTSPEPRSSSSPGAAPA